MSAPARFRLFLDTADTEAWQSLLPLGWFHGVTTNPTLLARAGLACRVETIAPLVARATALGCREVHVQAWGDTAAAMLACGSALAALEPERVVVKLPATEAGFRTAAALAAARVPITLTAVYTEAQALVASSLGVAYAAPYFGRIGDAGGDATARVLGMRAVLRTGGDVTRLLLASLRRPEDVGALAAAGCDTFTIGPAVAQALGLSEQSEAAAAVFAQDARGP